MTNFLFGWIIGVISVPVVWLFYWLGVYFYYTYKHKKYMKSQGH